MANEVRTNVVIEGKAKGLDRFAAFAKSLDSGTKGLMGMKKGAAEAEASVQKFQGKMKGLGDQLRSVAKEQLKLIESMQGMDRASKGFDEATKRLKALEAEQKRVESQARLTTIAYRDQAKAVENAARAKGSFTQGLLQGAVPGAAFLQRGPGMARQAAGAAIGTAGRGVAGGLASSPFAGASGIVSALQAIPIVGGALAAPIQKNMADAQQAMQAMQVRQAAMPFLGGRGAFGAARGIRGVNRQISGLEADIEQQRQDEMFGKSTMSWELGKGLTRTETAPTMLGDSSMPLSMRQRQAKENIQLARELVAQGGNDPDKMVFTDETMAQLEESGQLMRGPESREEYLARKGGAKRAELLAKRSKIAAEAAGGRMAGDIRAQGAQFGMDESTAIQFAAQVAQAGGGRGRELRGGFAQTAMAAQTAFGVDAGTSGAFLQAQRRGGILGGRGEDAGEALTKAMAEGMSLGLEGSELTDYMAQMAGDINRWKTTGIPFAKDSMVAMSDTMGRLVGGIQGARMGRQITESIQQTGIEGPQDALDMLMFQKIGGFQGGGAAAFLQAKQRLELGGLSQEEMQLPEERRKALQQERMGGFFQEAMGQATRGAEGADREALATIAMQRVLKKMGVSATTVDTGLIAKRFAAGDQAMGAGEIESIMQAAKERREGAAGAPGSAAELVEGAAGMTDPALKRQAELTNRQIATGSKLVGAMQNMDTAVQNVADKLQKVLGPLLDVFAKGLREATGELTGELASMPETVSTTGGAP